MARQTFRYLRPGEEVPSGPPMRHKALRGYVLLRWRVAPYTPSDASAEI
jgi:hypothetical protein